MCNNETAAQRQRIASKSSTNWCDFCHFKSVKRRLESWTILTYSNLNVNSAKSCGLQRYNINSMVNHLCISRKGDNKLSNPKSSSESKSTEVQPSFYWLWKVWIDRALHIRMILYFVNKEVHINTIVVIGRERKKFDALHLSSVLSLLVHSPLIMMIELE